MNDSPLQDSASIFQESTVEYMSVVSQGCTISILNVWVLFCFVFNGKSDGSRPNSWEPLATQRHLL